MNWRDLVIDEESTITQALEKLDETKRKILFVAGEDNRLLAALTDGDIRRWILKTGSLEGSVRDVANYSPIWVNELEVSGVGRLFSIHETNAIPVVDDEKRIKKILFSDSTELRARHDAIDIPVVINAGGKGTRLYPYTKILPKPLIPIGEIPISEHIINRFREYGCKDFYMIVNEKRNMIKAYYNELQKGYSLCFVEEDQPLGTGGGLSLLKGRLDRTFMFINCDTIIDDDYAKMLRTHRERGSLITVICAARTFTIPYGVVEVGREGVIAALREKPSHSYLVNTGCYIVEPAVIEAMRENTHLNFTDVIESYLPEEKVGIYPIGYTSWLDMGQFDQLDRMKTILNVE